MALKPIKSIAVLPFTAPAPGADGESLGLGLAEDLVTRLSSTRQIAVKPILSAARIAGSSLDPADVGRSLGVDAVLTGSVQKADGRIRFNAQLVRTEDHMALWAEKFDEPADSILSVQDRLTERLAQALALQLTDNQQQQLTKQYTTDREAFQLYMKAVYYWNKRTPEGFDVCRDYLKQALKKDPRYALAYAGMAATYSTESQFGFARPSDAMPQAEAAVLHSLQLDDALPSAHVVLGTIRTFYDWDLPRAEKEFQKAIELDPNDLEAHQYYGLSLAAMGRFADGRNQLQSAESIDPASPTLDTTSAYVLYLAHDYDEAIARCKKAIEVNPNFYLLHLNLGQAYAAKRMYDQAIAEFEKARIGSGGRAPDVLGRLGHAFGVSGKKVQARQLIEELKQSSAQPQYIAQVYIGLNEPAQALEWLEAARQQRSGDLIYLRTDPIYGRLQTEPGFTALLGKIGPDRHF
jgi:TolB-like protein/Flp pilus assembly protein TadD